MHIELENSKEILMLNIGQTGCQMGDYLWELFNAEHNINLDGFSNTQDRHSALFSKSIYNEMKDGKYVPRCLFVDLEECTINELKRGSFRRLYHPDYLLHGKYDSSNNFGRAYYSQGRKIIDQIMELVRRQVEMCDSFQGVFLIHSLGGGTGSGLYGLIVEHLSYQYRKSFEFDSSVFPSPLLTDSIVEPYNAVLATSITIDHVDLGFIMDNEACFEICVKKLGVERPTYCNINRLIAQVLGGITAPIRFKSSCQGDLAEFMTNLVPYPRIHFPLITFSPIITAEEAPYNTMRTSDLAIALFQKDHSFVKCDMDQGKFMSACVMFRGDTDLIEAKNAIKLIRSQIKFSDWCPSGVKLDFNKVKQAQIKSSNSDLAPTLPQSCTMAANHTSVCEVWKRIVHQFQLLYRKRAFMHWFIEEGVDNEEFELGKQEVMHILRDYEEISVE